MKATPVRRTRRKSSGATRAFFQASGPGPAPFFSSPETASEKSATPTHHLARNTNHYLTSLPGRGEALAPNLRAFFEARYGTEFGSVRIHRDADAAQSARDLHAQAYTFGNDIVFNQDRFRPHTPGGLRLLSHELVHVMQQRSGSSEICIQMKSEETQPSSEKKPPAGAAASPAEKQTAAAPAQDEKTAKGKEAAADVAGEKMAEPMTLPDFNTFGQKTVHSDFANNVTFNGKTDATFDGGVGHTKNLKAVPGKDCPNCGAGECVQVTGSLVIDYHVSTTVTLPNVPNGLTPCQEKIVRDAINNKIKPHEDQHVSAFSSYNGSVTLPINFNGCKVDLPAHVQSMHDAHAIARESAAKTQSAALDPFNVSVNLDCEDEPPKK